MIATTITCDICGKQKQQTNNWYKAHVTLKNPETFAGISIYPADEPLYEAKYLDLCGQECAVAALSKWMQEVHAPQK